MQRGSLMARSFGRSGRAMYRDGATWPRSRGLAKKSHPGLRRARLPRTALPRGLLLRCLHGLAAGADLHVPQGHLVAVVLQQDVTLAGLTKAGDVLELALRDSLLHLGAAALVGDDLDPVEPVLDVVALHHHPALVPLARRVQHPVLAGRDDVVERPGRAVAVL